MSKALPQRSIVRGVDRSSAVHLGTTPVQAWLQLLLADMLAPAHASALPACPSREFADWLQGNFRVALLAVRHSFITMFAQVPGLRYLASLFINVDQFEASVASASAEPLADPVITITPLISGWSLHQFARTALEMLRQPETCRHVDMLRHLHTAFARGAHLWDALAGLLVSPAVVSSLRGAISARRRMRKTRLRDAIKACTAAERCAIRLCLVSYLRSRRYTRFAMPPLPSMLDALVPSTSDTFYCCTVCGTTRSTVGGQGVKGATRCLYDFETRGLSCGKRGSLQDACSATPLMQVPLREGVFHVGNGQGAFARCPLCDCFFRYDLRAWTKGVFKCCACHYTIVDDCQLDAACRTCGRAFTSAPSLTRVGTVWVVRRACAAGCDPPPICSAGGS